MPIKFPCNTSERTHMNIQFGIVLDAAYDLVLRPYQPLFVNGGRGGAR